MTATREARPRKYRIRRCCANCGNWELVSPTGHVVIRQPTWAELMREYIHRRRLGLL